MRPALSIVVFTVLSGTGLGLSVALMLSAHARSIDVPTFRLCGILALALVAAGLASSAFHLANPRNAWRAIVRVRTSWLSREAVLAMAYFPLQLGAVLLTGSGFLAPLSVAVVAVALATIWCTGMIYASLKTIPQWNHLLTAVNYVLIALLTGFSLLAAAQAALGESSLSVVAMAAFFGALALWGKLAHFRRIGRAQPISVSSATGFTRARVRLFDLGHTGPTFLTREFVYRCPAARLTLLRRVSVGAGFCLPLALFGVAALVPWPAPPLAAASALSLGGALVERWLFFAEARHVVRLYHGDRQA